MIHLKREFRIKILSGKYGWDVKELIANCFPDSHVRKW
jgi:hypothetical protein